MKHIFALFGLVVLIGLGATVVADPYSNVLVGFTQGGGELYVKSGGKIMIDGVDVAGAVAVKETQGVISDISGANSGYFVAPVGGVIQEITYTVSGAPGGSNPTAISAAINGVSITGSSTTFATDASAYSKKIVAPSAANTVVAGDVIAITSDGEAANAVRVHAVVEIGLQ